MDYIHMHMHAYSQSFSVSYMDSSSALLTPETIYVSITLLIKAVLKKFHSQYPEYADGTCIQLLVRGSIKVIGSL